MRNIVLSPRGPAPHCRVRGSMIDAPKFQNDFLEALAIGFRKRRKAIRNKALRANYVKAYEILNSEKKERLEIDIEDGPTLSGATLRMHAWPDRVIWLDARKPTKQGWAWSWTYDGRLGGTYAPRDIVEALEQTHSLLPSMDKNLTQKLTEIWCRLLARGPSAVETRRTPPS